MFLFTGLPVGDFLHFRHPRSERLRPMVTDLEFPRHPVQVGGDLLAFTHRRTDIVEFHPQVGEIGHFLFVFYAGPLKGVDSGSPFPFKVFQTLVDLFESSPCRSGSAARKEAGDLHEREEDHHRDTDRPALPRVAQIGDTDEVSGEADRSDRADDNASQDS
ncbi:hypothetical protein IMZ11_24510 [Microtetraspora sp. AC03309]|uniref:hypothetical protein n=1 Tax=Microtetraspora sp. AC03309 TaxID=2779376 RepID=UPI001E2B79B6|nr:hypothetical protein [Microtetraspora sp. AC03309]MCC5578794.1 hypothetical protein [Microtetraspora sp. AC03309]